MRRILLYTTLPLMTLLASCNTDEADSVLRAVRQVTIESSVTDFQPTCDPTLGETYLPSTRVDIEGRRFLQGDMIRFKVVCPFTNTTQRGESTDGYSSDAFYLLKHTGAEGVGEYWTPIVAADGYDIDGDYAPRNSPVFSSYLEAQQTPFVYTAITWTEEKRFLAPTEASAQGNRSLIDQYSNVFHADQTKERNYLASDVLWAQTYRQTGALNVHLSFEHKMACLDITTTVGGAIPSANAVLTLEDMPDIDQAEIVVGDYYADASRVNSAYGYRQKASCNKGNHGQVIGVAVIDEAAARAKTYSLTGNPSPAGGSYNGQTWGTVPNTGTYTAHPMGNGKYRLIVPPCVLTANATFWLRDGASRYSAELARTRFVEGELYPVSLSFGSSDSGNGGEPGDSGNAGNPGNE